MTGVLLEVVLRLSAASGRPVSNRRCREVLMRIEPESMRTGQLYRLMTSLIVPRPIAWISTRAATGRLNLAPFSYYQGVASKPPLVSVVIARRGLRFKDTLRNITETGEFVINGVDETLVRQAVATSADFPPEVDEFTACGVEAVPSARVASPRVAGAPLAMECRLEQALELAGASVTMVIGRVLLFHLREGLLDGDHVALQAWRPVSRLGEDLYAPVREAFRVPRPSL